jgi:radical SAM protein with 4Fe4S-binding SPASM domain
MNPGTERQSEPSLRYFGLEVTRRCNLRCPHCFTASGGPCHPEPSTEQLCGLLTALAQAGVRTVAFSGGEPLLRADLEKIMHHGREAGISAYTLVTNGFLALPGRAERLRAAGLMAVQVSVDGVDAIDHVNVRQCSSLDFYRALSAIRVFQDAGMVVDVATILNETNAARAAEMLLLSEALRVRSLRYCTFVPTGRGQDPEIQREFDVPAERLDAFFELMRTVVANPGSTVHMLIDHGVGPWDEPGAFRCDAGQNVAYVSVEGDLYPCPGTAFAPFCVGNVYKSPVRELICSERLSEVRSIPKSNLGDPCRRCANDACSGGCRGAAFARSGNPCASLPYCNVIRRVA